VPTLFQANSSGPTADNMVSHAATSGLYTVTFPGLTDTVGNAQVTAQGTDSKYCKLRGVGVIAGSAQVTVACYTAGGTLSDSAFTVSYRAGDPTPGRSDAHGVANLANSTSWYTLQNVFNDGGTVEARRAPNPASPGTFLTGVYEVRITNQNHIATNVTVTALGTNGNTCSVEFWSGFADVLAGVRCRTPAGTLANTQFSLLFSTN
jgi:hypothetical protein